MTKRLRTETESGRFTKKYIMLTVTTWEEKIKELKAWRDRQIRLFGKTDLDEEIKRYENRIKLFLEEAQKREQRAREIAKTKRLHT